MREYKIQEKLKYAVLITSLVVTLLVASAFALTNKERAIHVRQMAHKAMHIAILTTD